VVVEEEWSEGQGSAFLGKLRQIRTRSHKEVEGENLGGNPNQRGAAKQGGTKPDATNEEYRGDNRGWGYVFGEKERYARDGNGDVRATDKLDNRQKSPVH